jgi:hypothetical protein
LPYFERNTENSKQNKNQNPTMEKKNPNSDTKGSSSGASSSTNSSSSSGSGVGGGSGGGDVDWLSIGHDRGAGGFDVSSLIGVAPHAGTGKWTAYLTVDDVTHNLGDYPTVKQAILVHDMEALRVYGLESGPLLNCVYEVSHSKEKCAGAMMRFAVKSADGVQFTVDYAYEDSKCHRSNLLPTRMAAQEKTDNDLFSKGANALPMIYGTTPIPHSDYGKKWSERIINSHSVASMFTMEIQLPPLTTEQLSKLPPSSDADSMRPLVKKVYETFGLVLELFTVSYPMLARGPRYAHCAAIVDPGILMSIVQPGDLLLSCGDSNLAFGLPGVADPVRPAEFIDEESGDFLDKMCELILQSNGLTTLKFLRRAGVAPNSLLSPAELSLLLKDVPPTARFSTVAPSIPGTEVNGYIKLHAIHMDSSVSLDLWLTL